MFKELFTEAIEDLSIDESAANGYLLSMQTYINDKRVKREVESSTRYLKTKNDFYKNLNKSIMKAMKQDDGRLPEFVVKAADQAIKLKSREMEKIINKSDLSKIFNRFGKTGRSTQKY